MAFVVEDGTGLVDANAYTSVSYVDNYFLDRNNSQWVGALAAKQAAIIKATDYIEINWGSKFRGRKYYIDTPQALSFPRYLLYSFDGTLITGIPDKLMRATAEYALRALTSELLPDIVTDSRGQPVISKTEKVGPLEETTHYQLGRSATTPFPAADNLLLEYVVNTGGNYR
jgi:hypothetical protein